MTKTPSWPRCDTCPTPYACSLTWSWFTMTPCNTKAAHKREDAKTTESAESS